MREPGLPAPTQAERVDLDELFQRHKRAQIRRGLALTPAERLRWLEDAVSALARVQQSTRAGIA